jgi:hypothetical protein
MVATDLPVEYPVILREKLLLVRLRIWTPVICGASCGTVTLMVGTVVGVRSMPLVVAKLGVREIVPATLPT